MSHHIHSQFFFSDPSDYSNTFSQLIFSGNGIQSVNISITDDSVEEDTESFTVSLVVDSQPPGLVLMQPASEAKVTIADRDGKTIAAKLVAVRSLTGTAVFSADEATIRFVPTLYNVNEEDMTATVFIELSGLDIPGPIVVNVSTGSVGDSAVGKLYYL